MLVIIQFENGLLVVYGTLQNAEHLDIQSNDFISFYTD